MQLGIEYTENKKYLLRIYVRYVEINEKYENSAKELGHNILRNYTTVTLKFIRFISQLLTFPLTQKFKRKIAIQRLHATYGFIDNRLNM